MEELQYYEDRALTAHSERQAVGIPPSPPEVMPEVSFRPIPLGHAQTSGDSAVGTADAVASANPREADPKAQSDAREEPPPGSHGSSRASASQSPGALVVGADGPGRQTVSTLEASSVDKSASEAIQLRGILGGQGGLRERIHNYRQDERHGATANIELRLEVDGS